MKQLIIIILFSLQSLLTFAQQEKSYVKKGNQLYQQQKYNDAEANYRKSVEKKNQNVEGNFNLGDALYKQKKFSDAGEQFNKLAGSANNKALTAAAYHNLGNSFLENKKLEESVDAYKKALLNNPKDDETRYNLAYAQEKLKKQQQQNKQNKQNKDNKDQQNQNSNNQDDKNKDNKNKDNKNQDKNQDKKDKQQQQPDKMSKEDAERMLDAMNNNEKQTQDKLKNKKLKGGKINITKDW
jgi:Ca-activated chloride channel family protein